MLTLIRNMLRTRLAGILFVLLIVAMGAWGVTDVFSGGLGNNLASAGDVKLSEAEFDQQVERELRTATDDRGRSLSKAQAAERGLIDQIYQRELFRTALAAYAAELGASATDQAVLEVIRNDDSFIGPGGTFDTQRYRQLLSASGFTPAMFERFIERDLTISRLTSTARAALEAPVSLAELQAAYSGELRKAAWFMLSRDSLPEPEPVSDEDIAAFYEEQKQSLTNPPRRSISLVNLQVDDFLHQSEFTDEELRAYYDAVKSEQFSGPGTRTWTQFVFESQEQARNASGRLAGGADPSTLPGLANTSQRSGTKSSMSSQALADQVFGPAAAPGSLFGPVETGNFFTVIRLDSIEPGDVEPFEEVRDQIVEALAREQAIGLYYDSLTQLDNLIGTGASLEEIGRQMGTPVLSFAPVDRSGVTNRGQAPSVLRQNQEILTRAFDLTEGSTTARFGADETAYVLRVDNVVEAFTPPLEDLQEDLRKVIERQRRSEALVEAAESIKSRLEADELTLSEAAEAHGATVGAPETAVTRRASEESGIPQAFISGLFSLRNEGDVFIAQTQNPNEVAIIELRSIDRPTASELQALASVSGTQVQQQLSSDLLEAFAADIQNSVDLQVNRSALEAYKARVNPDT
ncbi:SurA N-terminal domain-containing protein [Henriciella aquimarina]|uniref:SurA N-terminal domain-containing protein n=1 Tax=Henriciella aquimarina TaxID=545261 RepID=UPI000A029038|nr:SurA N-terminal domain-containing protein [Henriciella aquimarina]